MSDWNGFMRKVKTRQFAIDNSWKGSPKKDSSSVMDDQTDLRWQQLEDNLAEANLYKNVERFIPIVSHRRHLRALIVFFKKAVRKVLHWTLGWYIFPSYDRQSAYNGKIANVAALERELLADLTKKVTILEQMVFEQGNTIQEQKKQIKRMQDSPTDDDEFYHQFEEAFRGSRELIKNRLEVYVAKLKEYLPDWSSGKFVDIGSGRGEWLDILRENGATDYVGIDLNQRQNAICQEMGHNTVCMDCIQYLAEQPDNSIDMVSGFQIIEHLPMADIMKLFQESLRVLKPGGLVLFETQNPRNIIVGADTFYIDPSHRRPLEPRTMEFFAKWCGYKEVYCIDANSTPEWQGVVDNTGSIPPDLLRQFNDMKWILYGPQDYAILAIKE